MKTTLLSIIAILSLGLVGCSNMGTDPTETPAMYAVSNFDGTVETNENTPQGVETPRKPDTKKPVPSIFGDLLVKLNLTVEQRPAVERLLVEHRTCVESCVKTLKDAERQILMNARQQEETIKKKLKSGEITGEQARLELRQLRETTNAQLKELPKGKVRECVKSCDQTFIAKLREILTPEQKIILEKWLVSREKRGTDPTDGKKPGGRG